MTINATLDKTRKDIERTLADLDKTPLYAVVGVTDLAVEKIRIARARVETVQTDVRSAPAQVRALPVKAQTAVEDAITTALTAYDVLAGRGKNLVTRVRRQQSTADLTGQAKSTVARAKSTTTTVKKQTAATKKSASTSASTAKRSAAETGTARKSAGRAKSSAKATNTSARKTTAAAKKTTAATASKVGT